MRKQESGWARVRGGKNSLDYGGGRDQSTYIYTPLTQPLGPHRRREVHPPKHCTLDQSHKWGRGQGSYPQQSPKVYIWHFIFNSYPVPPAHDMIQGSYQMHENLLQELSQLIIKHITITYDGGHGEYHILVTKRRLRNIPFNKAGFKKFNSPSVNSSMGNRVQ